MAEEWLKQHTPISCVSNAVVIGTGIESAIEYDNKLRQLLHNEPLNKSGGEDYYLDILRRNYASGCSSILDIARISSRFNPFESQLQSFDAYTKAILSSPFFTLNKFEETIHHREESNWDSAVNAIVELYDGAKDYDKNKIKSSLSNLVKSAASRKNIKNRQTLFFQTVLNITDEKVDAFLYSTCVELEHSLAKSIDAKQIDIAIKRIELTFNNQLWEHHAHMVNKKQITLISDWISQNSLVPAEDSPKICILDNIPDKIITNILPNI